MKKTFTSIIILWISYIFLWSLPYKFSWAPETQHIFGTIWEWMKTILPESIWNWFISYWAIGTGTIELIVSVILLVGLISLLFKKGNLNYLIAIWWIFATLVMIWAVFFHLITPLTTVVTFEWQSDWWSLFRAAVSILILWIVLFIMYFNDLKSKICNKK